MGSAVFKFLQALSQIREKCPPISPVFCKPSGPDAPSVTVAKALPPFQPTVLTAVFSPPVLLPTDTRSKGSGDH